MNALLRALRRDLLWWIAPIVVVLVLMTVFLVYVEGSPLAPGVYGMF
ncbi:MAG TPA: DUF5989 family protein [Candidatus Dormibacteraeota bacterium]|nr:DUF5989 family protein [Candidatus Dormibacteraeota bacterium]